MPQAISRRPLAAEVRVRFRFGSCTIYGRQSGTGTGFSSSTSVLPCQFHCTGSPLKEVCTIRLQGCGASVATAAGPFNKLKNTQRVSCALRNYSALNLFINVILIL
jgi:hypothetical protein